MTLKEKASKDSSVSVTGSRVFHICLLYTSFVANGFYRNRTEFKENHIVYTWVNGKYPKVDRYLNVGRLIRLRESILVDMDFKRKTISHHEDIYVKYNTEAYKDVGRLRWDPFKLSLIHIFLPCCLEGKAEDGWDGELHFSLGLYPRHKAKKAHHRWNFGERVIAFWRIGPYGDDHKKQR